LHRCRWNTSLPQLGNRLYAFSILPYPVSAKISHCCRIFPSIVVFFLESQTTDCLWVQVNHWSAISMIATLHHVRIRQLTKQISLFSYAKLYLIKDLFWYFTKKNYNRWKNTATVWSSLHRCRWNTSLPQLGNRLYAFSILPYPVSAKISHCCRIFPSIVVFFCKISK
jgi:hypothetical protein